MPVLAGAYTVESTYCFASLPELYIVTWSLDIAHWGTAQITP